MYIYLQVHVHVRVHARNIHVYRIGVHTHTHTHTQSVHRWCTYTCTLTILHTYGLEYVHGACKDIHTEADPQLAANALVVSGRRGCERIKHLDQKRTET